jgi:hypothetical protein
VSVAKEEAQRVEAGAEVGGEIARLLYGPILRRVGGDTGDVQPSCAVFEEGEGVEAFAECGVDVEEVGFDDAAGLVGQKLFPGGAASAWGRVDAFGVEDLSYGRGGDVVSESGEFALDSSVAPSGVFLG